jgi:hypothetical protein
MMDKIHGTGRGRCHRAQIPISQAHHEAITTIEIYVAHITPEAQVAMDNLEAEIHQERNGTPDAKVDVEIMPWISNTSSTRAGVTKYFCTIDLY